MNEIFTPLWCLKPEQSVCPGVLRPMQRYRAWMLGNRVNCLLNPPRHNLYWMLQGSSEETMRPARCKAEISRGARIPVVGLGYSYSQAFLYRDSVAYNNLLMSCAFTKQEVHACSCTFAPRPESIAAAGVPLRPSDVQIQAFLASWISSILSSSR
jgi:hypothetical protein